MHIILTHENADFDAVASMLGVYKLNTDAVPILPKQQHANVREFLTLYKNGLPFIAWDDFNNGKQVSQVTITDTARRPDVRHVKKDTPTRIIDHHEQKRPLHTHEIWAGEALGAATTLLVERIREASVYITTLEATLLALGIYADTGNFLYGSTTPRDIRAAAWLVDQGADLDTVQRFLTSPLNAEQQSLLEQLLDQIDSRQVSGFDVIMCQAHVAENISSINVVVGVLRDILDADALIVLVAMPDHVQLIARSVSDAIHVGELATHFGGGGHPRAAAAAIHGIELDNLIGQVWHYLADHVQPAQRIAHLMSYGDVQTVHADDEIESVITQLRRIGHEGYPVMNNGQVVGLLTLRDADKALEHGLKDATVRDVMKSGAITLSPDDPVSRLEETMVNNDWGQIPIVDGSHKLIGIATRTDLIQHWAQTHTTKADTPSKVALEQVQSVFGESTLTLIETVAKFAQQQQHYLFLVGGIVRDLLLDRMNDDIDFVLEGDAIEFAEALQATFGGHVHPYPPFRTATWTLDTQVAEELGIALDSVPDHLDFATARSELYDHPTALPTIYTSGIKLDLRRRDFTINTLAVQLSPEKHQWQILDFYGGVADLDAQLIRVLHSLSFVDDPTRILRAVRFSERLQFVIEPRTAELIQAALPMLKRMTGERVQNELSLILSEAQPAKALFKLEALEVLAAIHPDFQVPPELVNAFHRWKAENYPEWEHNAEALGWHLMLSSLSDEAIQALAKRLLLSKQRTNALVRTSELLQDDLLHNESTQPSVIVDRLRGVPVETLLAIWLMTDNDPLRERIKSYYEDWQHIRATVDGNTLKAMGLKPGPAFRQILDRLQAAWIDGHIYNKEQEQALLDEIIREVYDERTG